MQRVLRGYLLAIMVASLFSSALSFFQIYAQTLPKHVPNLRGLLMYSSLVPRCRQATSSLFLTSLRNPTSSPIASSLTSLSTRTTTLHELLPLLTPSTALHLDLWGLLHSGSAPYPGVLEALDALHSKKVPMIVISNSSKVSGSALYGSLFV